MKKCLFGCLLLISTLSFSQEKKDSIPPAPPKWKVTGLFTFLFNQSTFTNWKAGGDNTIAGNIGVNYDFNYKNGKWNWDNRIITVYGLSNIQDAGVRKTSDRFEYNSLLGLKSNNYWFFSFFLNFKTQYSRGFDYKKTPRQPISDFFSPAYLSFGPGMLWKRSDNITVNIAPATSRFTFVSDDFSGKYGVEAGKNVKFALGFSLSAYLKFEVMENITMQNIIALYSNYLQRAQNVDLDYQAKFSIDVNKYMTVDVLFHTLIDDNASSKIQLKEIFGLGLKYVFHKK
ncbi:DUF3078 domain-containing protein [Polaribacter gochangensis]|uniref:DUF3078 domain-containing protein n=1 Tax=Polaribacter gochangensis TaxID=3252903 RepID=UPI0039048E55